MMQRDFPRLDSSQFEVTSSPDVGYNCVAWAAGDSERWWQPGKYWPGTSTGNEFGIATLEDAFKSLGYVECQDSSLEQGFEKVALYGSGFMYTHVALQMSDGTWTSKLGKAEDIRHESPENIAGGIYGEVVEYMKRPRTSD